MRWKRLIVAHGLLRRLEPGCGLSVFLRNVSWRWVVRRITSSLVPFPFLFLFHLRVKVSRPFEPHFRLEDLGVNSYDLHDLVVGLQHHKLQPISLAFF